MSTIVNYNENLYSRPLGSGYVKVTGVLNTELIEAGIMDSETLPNPKLIQIQEALEEQLNTIWSSDPVYWDANLRRLGGGVFVTNQWTEVEE